MTDDKIRIAVGEARGWRANPCGESSASTGKWRLVPPNANAIIAERFDSKEEAFLFYVPDYPNDLNAIKDAATEAFKTNDAQFMFAGFLETAADKKGCYHWQLTAADWCEAYLRTIGKWK